MRLIQFLSRLAFICNICFLLASFTQWIPAPPENALLSDIIVLGYLGALVVNLIVNLAIVILFVAGRLRRTGIPGWLLIVNFVFFIVQIVLLVLNRHLS
ncbi:MAG TPA: hypothetical protein VHE54_09435 [Puia sp.]|nr:hypothetical protein [Puia sp.]